MKRSRILGITHILVGLLLLPLTIVFGVLVAALLVLGPLWIIVLGTLLWRSGEKTYMLVRRTHVIAIVVAALLCVHGIFSLQAASRSAAEGGGLFEAYGLIPIVYGLLLGASSIVSLVFARPPEHK